MLDLIETVAMILREEMKGGCIHQQIPIVVFGADSQQQEIFREIEKISKGVFKVQFRDMNPGLGVDHGPVIYVGDKGNLRWTGMPDGLEVQPFAQALAMVCKEEYGVPEKIAEELSSLEKRVRIEVFTTPTCPACPSASMLAIQIAAASDGRVISDIINAMQYIELARKFKIYAVPTVVLSVERPYTGRIFSIGIPSPESLLKSIFKLGGFSE